MRTHRLTNNIDKEIKHEFDRKVSFERSYKIIKQDRNRLAKQMKDNNNYYKTQENEDEKTLKKKEMESKLLICLIYFYCTLVKFKKLHKEIASYVHPVKKLIWDC